jgi:hypothetical protein
MNRLDLYREANRLLRESGYGTDGSKLSNSSRRQRFFEQVIIIKTPMGNRR